MGASEGASSRLVYLYGFVEPDDPAISSALDNVVGVHPAAAVRLVREGGVAAVVGDVPAEEFSPEALTRKLGDMPSLEAVARGHERVLDALVRSATVLPARLGTLYRSEDDVRRLAADRQREIGRAFRRLDGVREWGVKLFVRRPRLLRWLDEDADGGPVSSAGAAPSRGAAYLAERQRQQVLEQRFRREVVAQADEVHEALRRLASDSRLVSTRAELASEDAGELALNGAYLVRREHEDDLHALVAEFARRLDGRGFAVSATGPWPPYNFVDESLA